MSMIVYTTGPVKFAKVFERNRNHGSEAYPVAEGGIYEVSVGVDDDMLKTIKKWNRLYQGKVYTDGGSAKQDKHFVDGDAGFTFITFNRRHEFRKTDGDLITEWSGAPAVVDKDGKPWDPTVNIGNGSICTIKLNVNKSGSKTFIRLEGVRVETHVPHIVEEDEVVNHSDGLPF